MEKARSTWASAMVGAIRIGATGALAISLVSSAALAWVVSAPFPLTRLADTGKGSTLVTDRKGAPLRELLDGHATRSEWIDLDRVSPWLIKATLAGEDHRFYEHPGVDPWALARALKLAGEQGRIYSGASTLTMQLVRMTEPRGAARTLDYKAEQAALALRLERALPKDEILIQYLNRLPYGNGVRGPEAASRLYFQKPAADLSLAEAALLAALPRSPAGYNPYRHPERALKRQRHILALMRARGVIDDAQLERALASTLTLHKPRPSFEAPHFATWLGLQHPEIIEDRPQVVRTTLDLDLQKKAHGAVLTRLDALEADEADQAAVVVLDNARGELLAMVGSRSWHDLDGQGRFNGATALRPSGSILAPFVSATAFEHGATLATVLPDLELPLTLPDGRRLLLRDHDRGIRGPLRLRQAIASNLEIPASLLLDALGNETVLMRLHAMNLRTLDQPHDRYGLVRPRGLGRASLLQLTAAFSALARGGQWSPPAALLSVRHHDRPLDVGLWQGEPARIFSPEAAFMVTDALSDEGERLDKGHLGPLPFPAAVATGSSDGGQDLWVIGYTAQVTVGVWVGRFDGRGRKAGDAAALAGPIFEEVMSAAMARHTPRLFVAPESFAVVDVCPLSGKQAGPACPHSVEEIFATGDDPTEVCPWHVQVPIDRRNGFQAGPTCPEEHVLTRPFTRLPEEYRGWAGQRPSRRLPRGLSPLCPVTGEPDRPAPLNGVLLDAADFESRAWAL